MLSLWRKSQTPKETHETGPTAQISEWFETSSRTMIPDPSDLDRFGHVDARRHLPSVNKQKDRRFKWFHVPMQNLQSCSRDTSVCLQVLGMFSALQALEILHSWLGNAQVATPNNVFSHVFCVSYLPEGF